MLWEADQSRKDNVSKRKAGHKAALTMNKAPREEETRAPGSKLVLSTVWVGAFKAVASPSTTVQTSATHRQSTGRLPASSPSGLSVS